MQLSPNLGWCGNLNNSKEEMVQDRVSVACHKCQFNGNTLDRDYLEPDSRAQITTLPATLIKINLSVNHKLFA